MVLRTRLYYLITLIMSCTVALPVVPAQVFLRRTLANHVLLHRYRRANSFLEELKLPNLERECLEEKCLFEEAKEIFSVPEQLDEFWKEYTEIDYCKSEPCKNGATCNSQTNTYICICPPEFQGRNCDKEADTSYSCLYKNGGCEHFCTEDINSVHHCHCAQGYKLAADNTTCEPHVSFPCGRPMMKPLGPRIVKGYVCPKGLCPWQALLELNGIYKCGGVVLNNYWILTAAHCVWQKDPSQLQVTVGVFTCTEERAEILFTLNPFIPVYVIFSVGSSLNDLILSSEHIRFVKEGSEQTRKVAKILIHPLYNHTTSDADLSLLRLRRNISLSPYIIPICLPPAQGTFQRTLGAVRTATVSGWGRLTQNGPPSDVLQRLEVPRVPLEKCRAHSGLEITNNMLCAGYREGGRDACQGDSGGPLVSCYNNTWFLTGIVSWGKGCAHSDMYGVYTRIAVFLEWIINTMALQ